MLLFGLHTKYQNIHQDVLVFIIKNHRIVCSEKVLIFLNQTIATEQKGPVKTIMDCVIGNNDARE